MIVIKNICRLKQVINPQDFLLLCQYYEKYYQIFLQRINDLNNKIIKIKFRVFGIIYVEFIFNKKFLCKGNDEILNYSKILLYIKNGKNKQYILGNLYCVKKFKYNTELKLNILKLNKLSTKSKEFKDLYLKTQLRTSGAITDNSLELLNLEMTLDPKIVLLSYMTYNYAYIISILTNNLSFLPENYFLAYHLNFVKKMLDYEKLDINYLLYTDKEIKQENEENFKENLNELFDFLN